MDFIDGLSNSKIFDTLWIVVDKLTKYNGKTISKLDPQITWPT